jgi:multiple sugar transport system ATP-binding protein
MTMGDRVAVLKRGELQQVAPPQELYENPSNLFVAGFIGSPAMNISEGTIGRDGDRWTVNFGDHEVVVPSSTLDRYGGITDREGEQVAVGIRPEHFLRGDDVTQGNSLGELEVQLVEMLGAEMLVHLSSDARPVVSDDMREALDDDDAFERMQAEAESGSTTLVGRFEPGAPPKVGSGLRVGVRGDRLHFFDIRSGSALR